MKIIEEYLEALYKNDTSKEIQDLKEELKEHLIDSTNEFIENGYDINEAQNKAIERFDSSNGVSVELRSIFKQKIEPKKVLLRKLSNSRIVFLNLFGWLLAATAYTINRGFGHIAPPWLIILLIISIVILIILTIIIKRLKKEIKNDYNI
ncbi:permease prefix domain 1-containing protein [Clostridioides difficile]|uniref:permease prefix domain 1-containing protein n=1 Tax=Clostridioides difficile TaxID=1496 RepID=UPI0021C9E483|nr:permease prefix domain 1-containing protein [Clostridioides difficile]UUV15210.1 permease prefix domain 1-containing protein [Clostridioides difficile]